MKKLYKSNEKRLGKSGWVFSESAVPVLNIRRSIRTAAKNAKIKRRITPNMMRHTFATIALKKGADIKSIQKILGHSNIETTMKYVHAIDEQLRDTVELLD